MLDLMGTAPNSPKFRASHGGEILAAHYIEQSLKFRQLYSKLTLTTSEDTNAHKMDALFVNTEVAPYQYTFVEAKSSILNTEKTKTKTHRSGILKAMVESLNNYSLEEPRMEFIRIGISIVIGWFTIMQKSLPASELALRRQLGLGKLM